jgi:hypothetical protein
MYAFTMTAVGTIARSPEMQRGDGFDYVEFELCGIDTVNIRGNKETVHTHVAFIAFNQVAEEIMENLQAGDRVSLQAYLIEAQIDEDETGQVLIIHSYSKYPERSLQ